MPENVTLTQKIYLLGIHPQKGGIISPAYTAMDYCLLGTLFLELYQSKKINFEKKKIIVLDTKADNELHRFILQKMSKSERPLSISRWINKFYFSLRYIRKEIQQQLTDKRLIRMESKRFLLFKWGRPNIVDKQFVSKLVAEVERMIFGTPASVEDIYLLTFIKPAGLLRRIFSSREKRKQASKRINKLMTENQMSIAVSDAISAAKAVTQSVSSVSASHQSYA